jgi:hypothetical protein
MREKVQRLAVICHLDGAVEPADQTDVLGSHSPGQV